MYNNKNIDEIFQRFNIIIQSKKKKEFNWWGKQYTRNISFTDIRKQLICHWGNNL